MLGILLVYFIGRYFYKLAETYNKNTWLYAVIGVIMYYVGTAFAGLILGAFDAIFILEIDWSNNLLMSFIALPFGLGACYLFYYLLKRSWSQAEVIDKAEIDDIGKDNNV